MPIPCTGITTNPKHKWLPS